MGKCANYQCKYYGQHHNGVGQSPSHPVAISPWTPVLWFLVIVIAVVLIVGVS